MSTIVDSTMNAHDSRDTAAVTKDLSTHLAVFVPIGVLAFVMFCVFPLSVVLYRRHTRKPDTLNVPLVVVKVEIVKHGRIMQTTAMGQMQPMENHDMSMNTQQRDIMGRMTAGVPQMEITRTSLRRPSISMSMSLNRASISQQHDEYVDDDDMFGDSEVIGLDIRSVGVATW